MAHSSLSGIAATDHHAAPAAGPDADVTVDAAGGAGTLGRSPEAATGTDWRPMPARPQRSGQPPQERRARPRRGATMSMRMARSPAATSTPSTSRKRPTAASAPPGTTHRRTSSRGRDDTASGLTSGHVLRATSATAFSFGAIADGDLPATIARDSEVTSAVSTHEGAADPHRATRRSRRRASPRATPRSTRASSCRSPNWGRAPPIARSSCAGTGHGRSQPVAAR